MIQKEKREFLSIVPLAIMDCFVGFFFLPSIVMILWHVMLDQDGCCPEMQLVSGKVLRDLSERWSHSCTVQGCGARKR